MRRRAPVLAAAALLALGAAAQQAAPVPSLTARVTDRTGTLSPDDTAALEQKLQRLEERKGSQIAVLLVPSTAPETIEQYGIRVAEAWKIGRANVDDGAILIVAKDDRRMRIEVGYGLEGALNDATCKRIIDEDIKPRFRAGDFAGGIGAGVDRMIGVIDGEPLPAPATPRASRDHDSFTILILFLFFLAFNFRLCLAALGGAAVGVPLALFVNAALGIVAGLGVFVALFLALPALAPLSSLRGGSGWSGGLGGGSFGGGGGGFSGGGGGFGGGGASGGW